MVKIALIGTGRIGTRLAEQIIMDGICEELYLWNRSIKKLNGVLESLILWKNLNQYNVKISKFKWHYQNKIDLFIIAVKEKYDPRLIESEILPSWLPNNLRYVGFLKDYPLLKQFCKKIEDYQGKVVVLTNPVDLMTTLVNNWIPNAQVLGLGSSLDSFRFSFFAKKYYKVDLNYYDTLLGGEHGAEIVPLISMWSNDIYSKLENCITHLIKKTKEVGFRIVKNLGYSLEDCVALFSRDISWILGRGRTHKYTSLSIGEKICIGNPVHFSKTNEIKIYREISDCELKKLEGVKINIGEIFENVNLYQNEIY